MLPRFNKFYFLFGLHQENIPTSFRDRTLLFTTAALSAPYIYRINSEASTETTCKVAVFQLCLTKTTDFFCSHLELTSVVHIPSWADAVADRKRVTSHLFVHVCHVPAETSLTTFSEYYPKVFAILWNCYCFTTTLIH